MLQKLWFIYDNITHEYLDMGALVLGRAVQPVSEKYHLRGGGLNLSLLKAEQALSVSALSPESQLLF